MPSPSYVSILACADSSYYTGSTQDFRSREKAHNDGSGAAYTYRRRPVHLVYWETFESKAEAVKRERQIKGWSRAKKRALITQNLEDLKDLSACRGHRPLDPPPAAS